jgi:hypothetical protein
MVRFSVEPADVADVEAAPRDMCAAVEQARPAGTRFASRELADGVSFLNVLQLKDGVPNLLPGIEQCRAFQQRLPGWAVGEPPAPETVAVTGSHELF